MTKAKAEAKEAVGPAPPPDAEPEKRARIGDADRDEDQGEIGALQEGLRLHTDPTMRYEAWREEVQKLFGFGSFRVVSRKSIWIGHKVFGYIWVDLTKDGAVKPRRTVADLKRASVRDDTFSLTPTLEARSCGKHMRYSEATSCRVRT